MSERDVECGLAGRSSGLVRQPPLSGGVALVANTATAGRTRQETCPMSCNIECFEDDETVFPKELDEKQNDSAARVIGGAGANHSFSLNAAMGTPGNRNASRRGGERRPCSPREGAVGCARSLGGAIRAGKPSSRREPSDSRTGRKMPDQSADGKAEKPFRRRLGHPATMRGSRSLTLGRRPPYSPFANTSIVGRTAVSGADLRCVPRLLARPRWPMHLPGGRSN